MLNLNVDHFYKQQLVRVNDNIIFVSDYFIDQLIGGAELTTEALIDASNSPVFKINSKLLNIVFLKKNVDKHFIFGNSTQIDPRLLKFIVENIDYSIIEYDYKFCVVRSPEKHEVITKSKCNCELTDHGKAFQTFYSKAKSLWWMSQKQMEICHSKFPVLKNVKNNILSSVFDEKTLSSIKILRENSSKEDFYVVLGSSSWIKGTHNSINWCVTNNVRYTVLENLDYASTLKVLARAKGLVYLPSGGDTCPRLTIEAKLLNCELIINDNVQQKDEAWFSSVSLIEEHLTKNKLLFWTEINKILTKDKLTSGYTTTLNCIEQEYPFTKCISSMLAVFDEVIVVDGGSTDGTWEKLVSLQKLFPTKLVIKQITRDWTSKNSALFDGMQKAESRKLCTGKFCWQQDADEVIDENDKNKIYMMCKQMPPNADVVSLPVVEWWGSYDKVRLDINPSKWRLSRNLPHITHGVPVHLRSYNNDGEMYALPGTDGCDMIDANTGIPVKEITFINDEVTGLRLQALRGNLDCLRRYEQWFCTITQQLPCVYHYSWLDIKRKINLYKNYWTRHWEVLYGKDYQDTASSNMFFDVPWNVVTDEMIERKVEELQKIGGWIWHRKYDGTKVPWITCNQKPVVVDFSD